MHFPTDPFENEREILQFLGCPGWRFNWLSYHGLEELITRLEKLTKWAAQTHKESLFNLLHHELHRAYGYLEEGRKILLRRGIR